MLNEETGEIADNYEQRLRRWDLQRSARRLLPLHRVRVCLRHQLPRDEEGVRVYRRDDEGTYYGGLMVCGSVWACPVCAAKVSERRRRDLARAVKRWRLKGGEVLMLTLTVPHHSEDEAFALVAELLRLVEAFNSGKGRFSAIVPGFAGQVRALEVTHGSNGWHPHLHVLVFVAGGVDLEALYGPVWRRWSGLVGRSGLGTPSPRAFSLQDGSWADAYVSKFGRDPRWSFAEEITKATVKRSRSATGRTPFALLEDAGAGDAHAGGRFAEFVKAFSGKRQLRWSPGLRDKLGLGVEKSDESEASTVDAADHLIARIPDPDWVTIVRHDLRALVLELLRRGSWPDVSQLLEQFRPTSAAPARARRVVPAGEAFPALPTLGGAL